MINCPKRAKPFLNKVFYAFTSSTNTYAIFNRYHNPGFCSCRNGLKVEGFYPTHINNTHRKALLRKNLSGINGIVDHTTKRQNCSLSAFTNFTRLTRLHHKSIVWHRNTRCFTTGIAQGNRPIKPQSSMQCMGKLGFV